MSTGCMTSSSTADLPSRRAAVDVVLDHVDCAAAPNSSAARRPGSWQSAHARRRDGVLRAIPCFGALTGPGAGAAATWVVRQVSRDAVVGCDPGMCRLLRAHGFPAGGLLVLGPGAPGLRLCDVIVATQAAGKLLGSRLEAEYAPAVIAGFGYGR